jgi:hypothetical protein
MYDQDLTHARVLEAFREEVFKDGILHEGDTIGTDDGTLLSGAPIHFIGDTLNVFQAFLASAEVQLGTKQKNDPGLSRMEEVGRGSRYR